MRIIFILIIPLTILVTACAPARFVEPLEKNEWAVGGNFGGPLLDFNAPVPIPLTAIEIGYGLDSNLTVFGGFHTTAALFGNLQIDLAMTYQFLDQKNYFPNLSVSPGFNSIYNIEHGSAKFWPILDANAWWNYGKRNNYFYVGLNNYFELSQLNENGDPIAQHWILNPQFGHLLKGKNQRWQFTTELKWLSPINDNTYAFVPYKTIGSRGAFGFFIGSRWKIGKN